MNPYDLVKHDGKTVDYLTHMALREVEFRLGYELTVVQGSYNAGGVAASGGTHDGGGVVDLAAYDYERKVAALRSVGFAAWYRSPAEGDWNAHVHAVLIGNAKLAPSAARQVDAYLAGKSGLVSARADDGPRLWVDRRFSLPNTKYRRARVQLERAEWDAREAGRRGRATAIRRGLKVVPRR
jgi:hypothetical protein